MMKLISMFFAAIVSLGTVAAHAQDIKGDAKAGEGINALTGADSPAPFGGAAFHDNRVALTKG